METSLTMNQNSNTHRRYITLAIAILIFFYSAYEIYRYHYSADFSIYKTIDWVWLFSSAAAVISSIGLFFQKKWGIILFTLSCFPLFIFFLREINNPICEGPDFGMFYCMFLVLTILPYVSILGYLWINWKKFI